MQTILKLSDQQKATPVWKYNEFDKFGYPHSRRREVEHSCGSIAKEVECFDVGMRLILCPSCGAMDY